MEWKSLQSGSWTGEPVFLGQRGQCVGSLATASSSYLRGISAGRSFQLQGLPSAPTFSQRTAGAEATSGPCAGLGFGYCPSLSPLPHHSGTLPLGWNVRLPQAVDLEVCHSDHLGCGSEPTLTSARRFVFVFRFRSQWPSVCFIPIPTAGLHRLSFIGQYFYTVVKHSNPIMQRQRLKCISVI